MSWSALNDRRRAIHDRWPKIWSLPVVPRSMGYAAAQIHDGDSVLDVGASDRRFGKKLPPGCNYMTVDIDPRVEPDYTSLDQVEEASVDVVVCFEMIEHVSLTEAREIVAGIARVLRPGGRLFLSTPNIHHPWSYLRSATHKTPFCYDELGGLLELEGLTVDRLFRCHKDAAVQGLLRKLAYPLYRIVGVDYAKSLLVSAHRPAKSTRPKI
ncbi:MAG: methyltransferase domain-containing protein [Planctomycetota bacterium]